MPNVAHREYTEHVQRGEHARTPPAVLGTAAGERRQSDMNGAEHHQAAGRGHKIDGEAADQPRHGECEQYREDGEQPQIIQQVDARIAPYRPRQELRCTAVAHRCRAVSWISPAATAGAALWKLLSSRVGCASTFLPSGCSKSLTCSA